MLKSCALSKFAMHTEPSSSLPSWWEGLFGAIRLCGVLNITGLVLTALGTWLTFKGRREIKRAREISVTARRNILTQVAASEFADCLHHVEMLFLHVGGRSWQISEHISSTLSTKLLQTKAYEKELQGLNRDALDVSVRTASQLREYLNSTTDAEPEKIQKGQQQCLFLSELLSGIHGSLRFRQPEEIV